MAKMDMHVHSSCSEHPSEWFLKRLGTRESYVPPETIYQICKAEGMDFVTLTDHNCIDGALELHLKHPLDTIMGVESTTYFPEDGTKIHVLIFGLNEAQYREIEMVRASIYDLRAFLVTNELAHAVAHATFSVNHRLTKEHVERLFLLFDHFEGINGSRNQRANTMFMQVLSFLSPRRIDELQRRYGIKPLSVDPWNKGIIAGSDDHSGLFAGKTFTLADAGTTDAFLRQFREKNTAAGGRHNDYESLAFAVFKIAYDFSKTRSKPTSPFFQAFSGLLFENKPLDVKSRIAFNRLKKSKKGGLDSVYRIFVGATELFQTGSTDRTETNLAILSRTITEASDEFVLNFFREAEQNLANGDIIGFINRIVASIPGVFLSLPFFTSLNVLNASRDIIDGLADSYIDKSRRNPKRVLWFTDTLTDLNGVSEVLREMSAKARKKGIDCTLVTSLLDEEKDTDLPQPLIDLPCIHTYTPSYFSTFTLRMPSVLASLSTIYKNEPDEIFISTPGPVGLIGLLAAKLLHIPCTGVYHTDFTRQAHQITGDDSVAQLTEAYLDWFYSSVRSIAVPTTEYMSILAKRGIPASRMIRFFRGIDAKMFCERPDARGWLHKRCKIQDGPVLLYAGRISKEKNLDFLASVYRALVSEDPSVNIVFTGNGPDFAEFCNVMKPYPRAYFTGRLDREDLPILYSAADCFVFPSITDTFGMVVLEAQACGLPAIVSEFGGPREIICNGKTGFIANAKSVDDWKDKIMGVLRMKSEYPSLYAEMKSAAVAHVRAEYSWDKAIDVLFSDKDRLPGGRESFMNPVADIMPEHDRAFAV
jgi:glycosyltransferase involved in cell wall biosynthesis